MVKPTFYHVVFSPLHSQGDMCRQGDFLLLLLLPLLVWWEGSWSSKVLKARRQKAEAQDECLGVPIVAQWK